MKSICLCLALIALATAEITVWNEGGDKIADDLIIQVAAGEEAVMVIFYKDQTHKSRLESKINDEPGFDDDDFALASVDMNSNKYMDLARDVRISTAKDSDYPIVGVFKNGKGYVVKQYGDD